MYGPDFIPLSLAMKIVYSVIAGLGIIGNSLAIYVLAYMMKSRKGNTNILLINQSVIDLVASILLVLGYLLPYASMPSSASMKLFVCYIWNSKYLFWATTVTSTINLLCLTYERYYAILHPIRYRTRPWLVWPRSILLALLPWILGYLFESYFFAMHYISKDNLCKLRHWKSKPVRIVYSVAQVTVTFFVPIALMVFAYVRIYRAIREHPVSNISTDRTPLHRPSNPQRLSPANRRARRSIIKTLVLVCATFSLCWLPNQLCYTYYNINYFVHFNVELYGVAVCIAFFNMCANPFIYTLQYRGFRKGLLKAVPCLARFHLTRNALKESDTRESV